MNELGWMPEGINLISLGVSLVLLIVGLFVWFFVNRASVRATEQIALLEELIDLQKRQNSLLRRLCEANEPEPVAPPAEKKSPESDDEFAHLVAER